MRRRTSLTVTTTLGLVLLVPTLGAGTATAAGETCRGEAATIVGAEGVDIVGTEGRDVVVTNQSQKVRTLGGDDLVCITGPAQTNGGYRSVDLDTGDGDDVVDGTAAPSWPVRGSLGAGADTFYGGAGADTVSGGTDPFGGAYSDTEHDVLVGGGGNDVLTSGQQDLPNTDVIDLGEGDDFLTYRGAPSGGSSVTGGGGFDDLFLTTSARDLEIDNGLGRLVADGQVSLTWTGLEGFTVAARDGRADLTFTGTGAGERLVSYLDRGVVRASLGGGRDTFVTGGVLLAGSRIDGGAQRDLFYVTDRASDLDLDLARGSWSSRGGPGRGRAAVVSFEDAELHGRSVRLAGDGGDNRLGVSACTGRLSGRGGNDVLGHTNDSWFETGPDCKPRYVLDGGAGRDVLRGLRGDDVLRGGPGNDTLVGDRGDDRLIGGPGRDKADGGEGRDVCDAEKKVRCER
jgi:Ca2+-binding RTX toxin-like protein